MTSACQAVRLNLHDEGAAMPVRSEDVARAATGAAVPAPLARLLAAANSEERQRTVNEMVGAIGCDWLVYGRLAPEHPCPVPMYSVNADPQWVRRYADEGYHEIDPCLHDAMRSWLPCIWTLAELQCRALAAAPSSRLRRHVADLAGTGMRGGVVLVLPGDSGGTRHVVSLLAREPSRRLVDGELLGEVLAFGMCLHEYFTRHDVSTKASGAVASLTPVQREILGHVARGESDKRIAHYLRISSHAVDYHMRQLRHRFAVHNRVQLAQASRGIAS
jgi:DNA-binding CsgD family transcriptional regulator